METSRLIMQIKEAPGLQGRIVALVQNHRWNTEGAQVGEFIDVENISWAVATNPTVLSAVSTAVDNNQTVVEAVGAIPDSDLEYIIMSVAIPRLEGP